MKAHILLVEDDAVTRHLLTSLLNSAGYQVTAVPDGSEAISLLSRNSVDVVVTDIQMRNVDGMVVLQTARSRPQPPEVILMTGYGSMETAVAAIRAGAYNYLLKPCSPEEVLECVAGALQRRLAEQRHMEALRIIAEEYANLQNHQAVSPAESAAKAPVATASAPAGDRYLYVGALSIDSFRYTATFDNKPLHLTPTEYAIIFCLAKAQQRLVSYREIVAHAYGYEVDDNEAQELLKSHIRNLRRKIPPDYLITVRNAGYILAVPEHPAPQ